MLGKRGLMLTLWLAAVALHAQGPQTESASPVDVTSLSAAAQSNVSPIGVTEGGLIKRVSPKYPKEARKKHIEGAVILTGTITKDGEIADLLVVTGDQLLAQAAMDAVKNWKYRPYLLVGKPVWVKTQITVNFKLPHH